MNFQEARESWRSITEQIDDARIHAHRVLRDPLPINTEDVLVMRERLEAVQRVLADLRRGLEA